MGFRILLGIDAIIALIFIYFFLIGLGDGTVSSFNMALWVAILAGLGSVLFAGITLRARGQTRLANVALAVLAVPGILASALFLIVMSSSGHH